MKKYITPAVDVIEMDTASVIATSVIVDGAKETYDQGISRRRGERWGSYDDN